MLEFILRYIFDEYGTCSDYFETPREKLLEKDDSEIDKKFSGDDFIVYLVHNTHMSITEAYASPDVYDWKENLHNEMDSILVNDIWELSKQTYVVKL